MPEPVEHVDTTDHIQPSNDNQPAVSELASKRRGFHLSRVQRIWLGIAIICLMVVGAFYAPPEGDSSNVMGDPASIPTVVATNLLASTPINRQLAYQGLQFTIQDAKIAQKFSDDRLRNGKYTLRVNVFVKNVSQSVIGVNYAEQVRLIDAHGQVIPTKFISIKPTAVPGSTQTGSFDFALTQVAPLSTFSLRLDANTVIPLK